MSKLTTADLALLADVQRMAAQAEAMVDAAEQRRAAAARPAPASPPPASAPAAPPAPPPAPATARLVITPMTEVTATEIDWLWPGWLARGKLHLLGGHPGDGKSTLMAALAASASRGGAWPDGQLGPPPLRSLFLLGEDAAGDTLKPRLALHEADMQQVLSSSTTYDEQGRERGFDIRRHLPLLEAELAARRIDLLVIDPLTTVMPGTDRNAEGETRDQLTPLVKLAERAGVAMVGIVHVGKSGDGRRAAQKILGATAFVALARLVWMVAPEGAPGDGRMALGVVKSNIGRKPPTLAFERADVGAIVWAGEAMASIEALMSGGGNEGAAAKAISASAEAEAFLYDLLDDGDVLMREVEAAARSNGISRTALRRASETIGVQKRKATGPNGAWMWTLPKSRATSGKTSPNAGEIQGNALDALDALDIFPTDTSESGETPATKGPCPRPNTGNECLPPPPGGHWSARRQVEDVQDDQGVQDDPLSPPGERGHLSPFTIVQPVPSKQYPGMMEVIL